MAEIVYRQMPAPRDIPQKMPAPRAKIRMQKPQSGGEFSVQIPGGARGGMVMAKIDNCISTMLFGWCSTGGGGVFSTSSLTPLSLKLDYSNFVQDYFGIR